MALHSICDLNAHEPDANVGDREAVTGITVTSFEFDDPACATQHPAASIATVSLT